MRENAERTAAPVAEPEAAPKVALQEVTSVAHVLAMQRTAGNAKVVNFLSRAPAPRLRPRRRRRRCRAPTT